MEAQSVKSHLDKFLSGLSDLQVDLTLALCPFFDRSVFLPVKKRSTESIYLLLLQHVHCFLLSLLFPGRRARRPQEGWGKKHGKC